MLCFKPISSVINLSIISSSSNSVSNGARSVIVHCSPQKVISVLPLKLDANGDDQEEFSGKFSEERDEFKAEDYNEEKDKFEEERRIGGIDVPRQKYIAVPKAELLDAVLDLFESEEDKESFKQFARSLDSILHAEHKDLLEEMRAYYSLTHQEEEEVENAEINKQKTNLNGEQKNLNGSNLSRSLDFKTLLASSPWLTSKRPTNQTRVAFAANFQRNFMKLLKDAQFEELSARDLLLTYALNSDYILTLPIYVDWKKASESNAIIFRRGYASERQKGLLLVEKLDYLQSKLLQRIFFGLSKPLKNLGKFINEVVKKSTANQDLQIRFEKLKQYLNNQSSPDQLLLNRESKYRFSSQESENPNPDLPIWIAAQKAVSRYEGLLSPVGPRGRLVRKLLSWTGLVEKIPEASVSLETEKEKHPENYLRPNFLPRVTLANIWEPATRGNNLWEILKASVNILFKESTLQEPAFQELILLYTDGENQNRENDKEEFLPLKLKIYENIPIPDLPVVFPHKKLSFRILDTVRLDLATIVGSLAFLLNYKFENIAASPSAILLDAVAATALAILVFRVVLGYKQTSDRYQLLVNKTLYEKTLASGFGSVHFLLDASEQQQYKEAVLVYALLLSRKTYKVASVKSIRDACEQFMYDKFREKIEMPVAKATETLLRFNLVNEFLDYEEIRKLIPVSCSEACEILKNRWRILLEKKEN